MGILDWIFGTNKNNPKPGSQEEAQERANDAIYRMAGISDKAKWSSGYPICPKCRYKFPMSKNQVNQVRERDGIASTICPKCHTGLRL